jgi:hypothetical protein
MSPTREIRKNVVLLGDIIEDATMVDHDRHHTVVKVGFLNSHDDQKMKAFEKVFDLIV